MADAKISQLPVATSSAGTDVLPIVQSSTTKQLAIENLVPQNLKSNATTGVLQVTGPAAGTTRIMTAPNANFTVARTDAAQSFTGAQTFATTISVGNATPAASGAGVTFPVSQSSSSDVNTLDDYEEGSWTPTIERNDGTAATLTYAVQVGKYTKVGNLVVANANMAVSGVTDQGSGNWTIHGLPFACSAATNYKPAGCMGLSATAATGGYGLPSNTFCYLVNAGSLLTGNLNTGSYMFSIAYLTD